MTDRPILFSGPMVRALLEGRKTQTRRIINPQPHSHMPGMWRWKGSTGGKGELFTQASTEGMADSLRVHVVKFDVGDRLWVRESIDKVCTDPGDEVHFMADWDGDARGLGWRPSIHMPRWASRLTLTVTDVRVQRLQDISEADAIAEGIVWQEPTAEDRAWALARASDGEGDGSIEGVWLAPGTRQGYGARPNAPKWGGTPEFAFRLLWDSLNADRGFGWETNPWVVALTFTVEKRNIAEPSHV